MNELVFLEPNKIDAVPFTTSDVIAEYAGIAYRSVQKTIETHRMRLESLGILRFEITVSGKAGRPKIVFRLTEEQATLLITFLKNTEVVANFKTELVRQFFAMRNELNRRQMERIALKPIRREMTDVIQQVEDGRWSYKKYTDLAYINVMGKTAKAVREERNAPVKATAIDYMTAEEIHAVAEMQYRIAVLLETGMNYFQIKGALANRVRLVA